MHLRSESSTRTTTNGYSMQEGPGCRSTMKRKVDKEEVACFEIQKRLHSVDVRLNRNHAHMQFVKRTLSGAI